MEGFFLDYLADSAEAFAALTNWVRAGDIRYEETTAMGLEAAPAALSGLFKGRDLGRKLVQFA